MSRCGGSGDLGGQHRILSVRQPWAWAIVHGFKNIENRTWRSRFRGRLFIHASMKQEDDDVGFVCRRIARIRGLPARRVRDGYFVELQLGAVIGAVTMVDCVETHASIWFEGPHGFVFEDPCPLPVFPLRGKPGIFKAELRCRATKPDAGGPGDRFTASCLLEYGHAGPHVDRASGWPWGSLARKGNQP